MASSSAPCVTSRIPCWYMLHARLRGRRLQTAVFEQVVQQQVRALRTRDVLLVRDPLSALGSTATMGARELLDAVDRAEGLRSSSHRMLWERLSCRAQALMPDFTAQELCRVLFGFHRARCRDEALLQAACEAILNESPGKNLLGNDSSLLVKAFSKHQFLHEATVDFLVRHTAENLQSLTAADASHLLAAILRLGVSDWLQKGARHSEFFRKIFNTAKDNLNDAYLPPADLTNLCAAAALCEPTEESSQFLETVMRRFDDQTGVAAAMTPPRDVVRRLQSLLTFDAAVRARLQHSSDFAIVPITERLGSIRVSAVCRMTSRGLKQRLHEINVDLCVAACEAMAGLLPYCGSNLLHESVSKEAAAKNRKHGGVMSGIDQNFWGDREFGPILSLALQRLAGMSMPLLRRLEHAIARLSEHVESLHHSPPVVLRELSVAIPLKMGR